MAHENTDHGTLTFSQFSNLLGTVYRKGNLLFTPDGTCLLSPVGNRVTVFDLVKYVSRLDDDADV
jgi:periodic tryptophan protein 2